MESKIKKRKIAEENIKFNIQWTEKYFVTELCDNAIMRSSGGGIATVYKSTLGSNITFKTNFDFTHTSFEVVQASITLQHNTLHFFCLYRPPPNRRNNLTDSMFT